MKPFDKLKIKIKKELDIELYNFKRTRIGYSGRECGAFTWVAQSKESPIDYGSCTTVKELLKAKELDMYYNSYGIEIHEKDK
jgi:hypothetical protein